MALSSPGDDNRSPERNFRPGNIFIGRVHEINNFHFYLDQWKAFMKSNSASTGVSLNAMPLPNSKNKIQGLVVLLYGRGGFGKSTLLERYRKIARQPQTYLKVSEIVDWEAVVEGNRNMFSSLQGQEIDAGTYFGVLRAQLADALGKRGAPFREFDKAVAAVEHARKQFNGELDNLRKDNRYDWLMKVGSQEVVAIMRAAVPALNLVPGIDMLADGAKQGLELAAQFGAQQATRLHDRLRDRLGSQTLNDYLAPAYRLGVSLGSDLANFARDFPLLIFFDTYELVDEGDRLLRIVMGAAGARVGWVIAGRDNLWAGEEQRKRALQRVEGYKEIVERGLPVDFNAGGVGAFTASDIVTYFEELCLSLPDLPVPLTEEEAGRIYDMTQGVPLAVRIAAGLYLETGNLDIVTARVDKQKEIVDLMVQRYLQHVQDDQAERGRLRGLALLRRADQPAGIAAALGLSPEQAETSYEKELSRLHRRYSFIFNEGTKKLLHQEVRYFLRLWLRENRSDPEIIAVNRRLWQAHAAAMQMLETSRQYTNLRQRLEDEEWVGVYLDLVEQQFWLDPAAGVQYSLPFMLAAAIYRRDTNQEAVSIGSFFVHELKQPYRNWWQWAIDSLVPGNSRNPSPEALRGLEELARLVSQRGQSFLLSLPDYRAELEAALWWRLGEAYESRDTHISLEWYEKALTRLREDAELREDAAGINWKIAEKLIFEEKQYRQSLPYLERVLELKPDYTSALNGRGVVYKELKEYQQAINDYNRVIELDPKGAYVYINRGNLYSDRKEYDQALRDYDKALELDPSDIDAYNGRGVVYFHRKEYDQALRDYDKALELDPNYVRAYNNRGNLYTDRKEYDQASRDYDKALELDPSYTSAYNNRGRIYHERKEYDQALQDYNKTLELDPGYVHAYNNRGLVYHNRKEYDLALREYNKALELDPGYVDAYDNRGDVYYARKEYDQALRDYNKALELDPSYAIAYNDRGRVYRDRKEYDQALRDYNKALELDPTYVYAYSNRGRVYRDRKEYELALRDYNKALELDPDDIYAYYGLAILYLLMKRFEQSIYHFVRVHELNPTDINAPWMAEWVGMGKQRPGIDQAERLEKIAERKADSFVGLVCQSVAMGLHGNLREELEKLEQAISLEPEEWDAYFWKGMTCAYLGRYTAASEAIDRALELDLPPVLLTPLYWLERDRPDFFREYARPMLKKYGV